MTIEPWDDVEEGAPDRRRVFTVRSDRVRSRKTGKVFTVDRLLAPDWVNVVAITEHDELILVRQWRFGARAATLELPAGLVEPDEPPLLAGLRELREETGYAPADVDLAAPHGARVIGTSLPNPAFMNNVCTTILVPRCVRVGEQQLDPMEEVEVTTLPVADVDAALARGELSTALGLAGLLWWRLHTSRKPGG